MDISSIWQYLSNNFWSLTIPIIIAVALFAVIYFAVKFTLKKSQREKEFVQVIMALFRGPIPVIIIGYTLVLIARFHPSVYPPNLSEPMVIFIVELLLLLTSINATRKISGIILKKFFSNGKVSKRFLLVGVYSLGLIFLFYIILTSPISLSFQQGALPAISFITGVVVTYLIAYIINLIISRYQVTIQQKQPQLNTTITFGRRVIMGVVILIGVGATAFASFPGASGAVASLFVAAGFTSIVIGLAAQSSLSNLIAGGVISTSQPFRIGDAIIYDNEYCYVEDIRLMFCILKTWDNRRLMVPNQMFLNSVVKNYTAVDATKTAIIYVQITLESDLDLAMDIMKKAIRDHPNYYHAEGFPSVQIMEFTEYGVQLRALGRTRDQGSNWNLEKEVLYTIKKEFDKNGVKIAVPRREVIISDPDRIYKRPEKDEKNRDSSKKS